jgi:hypothetical protein
MRAILPFLLLLTACGGDKDKPRSIPRTTPSATGWQLEWSQGARIDGNVIHIPANPGVVGTATKRMSLSGKSVVRVTYRLDGVATGQEGPPATISLYFQREGDDWTAQGPKEAYRWYCGTKGLVPGEDTIECRLSDLWTAILTSSNETNPQGFADAVNNVSRVGIVFGNGEGKAHGVYGPATLTIIDFTVE